MSDVPTARRVAGECPKRVWVMLALSDDEASAGPVELAPGLRLHLSRCESCRALAERMSRVGMGLSRLGGDEPPPEFAEIAVNRARDSARAGVIRDGADSSRRDGAVDEPEDFDEENWNAGLWRRARWALGEWTSAGACNAVAAALLVGVIGVWSWARLSGRASSDQSDSGGSPIAAWFVDETGGRGEARQSDVSSNGPDVAEPGFDDLWEWGLVEDGASGVVPVGASDSHFVDRARDRRGRIRSALESTGISDAPGAWIGQSTGPRPAPKRSKLDISRPEQSTEKRATDR